MTNKVKLYRNPERNKPANMQVHTPFYQQAGIEPQPYVSPTAPNYHAGAVRKAPLSKDNPRAARPVLRQPYAESAPSPVGRGRGLLPNVGNNLEQTWTSVDGEIIDDISGFDPNAEMIDNNEFVSAEALGLPEEVELSAEQEEVPEHPAQTSWSPDELYVDKKNFLTEDELQGVIQDDSLSQVIHQLEENDYLLMVSGDCIASGPLEEIQEHARLMAFGEHPLCNGVPVSIDEILVLKRVAIKVGLFLS